MGILFSARPKTGRLPQRLFLLIRMPFCGPLHFAGPFGAKSILFLLVFSSIFAFPAPSGAQPIDGWLVGYRFECCPQRNINRQFMVIAVVDYPLTEQARNRAIFLKYQVDGNSVFPSRDTVDKNAMRNAILGIQYVRGSQIVRDFQRVIGNNPDGNWDNSTWKALYDYADNITNSRDIVFGQRRLHVAQITRNNTNRLQRVALSNSVENDNLSDSSIPSVVLDSFLRWEPPQNQPLHPLTEASASLISQMPVQQRAELLQALSLLPGEQQTAVTSAVSFFEQGAARAGDHRLSTGSETLVNSVPGSARQALREALSSLDSNQQQAVATLVQTREAAARRPLQSELAKLQRALEQADGADSGQAGPGGYELEGFSKGLVDAAGDEYGKALEEALKKLPGDGQRAITTVAWAWQQEAKQAASALEKAQRENERLKQIHAKMQDEAASRPQALPNQAQETGKTYLFAVFGWLGFILLVSLGILVLAFAFFGEKLRQNPAGKKIALSAGNFALNLFGPAPKAPAPNPTPIGLTGNEANALAERLKKAVEILEGSSGQTIVEKIEEIETRASTPVQIVLKEILNRLIEIEERLEPEKD